MCPVKRINLLVISFFVTGLPMFSQDAPVDPTGTQVATQQTPAADTECVTGIAKRVAESHRQPHQPPLPGKLELWH